MGITHLLTLPDQRQLAYAEYGDPAGHPVLYFHSSPSSRLEPALLGDEVFTRLGLRVIASDRPGMGQSDFLRDREFSDWVHDVEFLADALELRKFSILGVSGGSGYVVACAARIPERIHAAVIVSGAWQINQNTELPLLGRLIWFFARQVPSLHLAWLKLMQHSLKGSPEQLLASFKKQLPLVDYQALQPPGRMETFCQAALEAMEQGVSGASWDLRLYCRNWDFRLEEIQIPLTWFHGEQDVNVPISSVRQAMASLPTAQLLTYPEEGHLSLVLNQIEAIAKSLLG